MSHKLNLVFGSPVMRPQSGLLIFNNQKLQKDWSMQIKYGKDIITTL